jgi:hypothetical protein
MLWSLGPVGVAAQAPLGLLLLVRSSTPPVTLDPGPSSVLMMRGMPQNSSETVPFLQAACQNTDDENVFADKELFSE